MSVVTTLILTVDSNDLPNVERLNDAVHRQMSTKHHYYRLTSLSDHSDIWGGSKVPQAEVFGGAFNHLDLDQYLSCFQQVAWDSPECMRLMVKSEWDHSFDVYVWSRAENRLNKVI